MSAEHEGSHVFHADLQFLGNEGAEAGGIEHAGHANHAIAGELADLVGDLRHGIERVGNHNQDAVGRVDDHVLDNFANDFGIGIEQVITAHSRLAGDSRGNHYDVRVSGVFVIVGAEHVRIALLDGHGFEQIQSLALRHAFYDIDQDNIGKFLGGDPMGGCSAYVSSTYDGYFFAHSIPSSRFIRAAEGGCAP